MVSNVIERQFGIPSWCAMPSRKTFLRKCAEILIENVIIYLMSENVAVGHWNDMENKANGMRGVLGEAEDELWQDVNYATGPFEPPNGDSRLWMQYINGKTEILKKAIADIENRLPRAGPSKMESLSKGRKVPGNDMIDRRKNNFPALRLRAEMLKNLSAELRGMKMSYDEHAPLVAVHEAVTELERMKDVLDLTYLGGLLKTLRRGRPSVMERVRKPCEGADGKTREILERTQRNFSEMFLYRNITLEEIVRMSKIVDFVDRYRGRVRGVKFSDPVEPGKLPGFGPEPGRVTPED